MDSYLEKLAHEYAQRIRAEHISSYAFVFPNRRAGVFFRKYLGEAYDAPVFSPMVMTINDCFYSLSDLELVDPIDLIFRLYGIYRKLCGHHREEALGEDFEHFLFWGKMMAGDFSEIDNHLVGNVRELFTTIRDLKELEGGLDYLTDNQREAIAEFWTNFYRAISNQQHTDGTIRERFLYIWQLLWPIYEQLQKELTDAHLGYDGLIHRQVIEQWEQIAPERKRAHYVFIGFHTLTRSEERLIHLLEQEGRAEIIRENESALTWPDITHVQIPSTVGEAHEVHRILTDLYPEGGDFTRTAVVLPDERMLLPLLHTLPEQIDKVNVTMGYPLAATPTFALLQLLETLRRRATSAGFYHKDIVAVLSHRYIRKIAGETALTIMRTLRETNRVYMRREELCHGALAAVFDTETATIAYLRNVLAALDETDSEELFLVQTGINRIEQSIGEHTGELTEKAVFSLANMVLSDLSIPYSGEPLEGLQIMGVLETRALDFENVIITGFNDDIYPGKSRGNSFIPYILRRGFDLPTSERQDTIFAHNFYRLIRHASRVWLLTNSRADDQHSGEPSRYLAQLRYEHEVPIHEEVIVPGGHIIQSSQRIVEKTDTVMRELQDYATGSKRGFSPSALNNYLRCPILFYWQNIAGLHETEEVTEELSDRDLGTLVHATLETLYSPMQDKIVQKVDIARMQDQVEDTVRIVAEKENIRISTLTHTIVARYVSSVLEHDEYIGEFTYLAGEQSVSMSLTLDDGQIVRLKGIIDRIDSYGLSTRLIDYKSGHADTTYESIHSLFDAADSKRNPYALQTILYCLLYQSMHHDAIGIEPHIYALRNQEINTRVQQKNEVDFNLKDVEKEFVTELKKLITEILDQKQAFTPTLDAKNCENCAFKSLCL